MTTIKKVYQEYGWAFRFIIILIIALWINFKIVPDLKIPSDNLQKITEDNTTYLSLQGYFDLKQEDLNSGNLNTIFWKLIYLGGGKDKICFEKTNLSNDETFFASYNGGEIFNVTNKKCFDILKDQNKITFNVGYSFKFTIPERKSEIVNESDCIPETKDYSINYTCVIEGKNQTCHTCLVQGSVIVFHPDGEVYLEPNLLHKMIKFIFVFFLTGSIWKIFSGTIEIILYGWIKK